MTMVDSHDDTSIVKMEKSDAQVPDENSARRATEDPERDAGEKQQMSQKETASSEDSPTLPQLLIIGMGLWFAVFLIALVSFFAGLCRSGGASTFRKG